MNADAVLNLLSISRENGSEYCVAAHSAVADAVSQVPREVVDAIREDRPFADLRMGVLSGFTRTMITSQGRMTRDDIAAFYAVGFSREQVLEIVLAIAVATMSNYTNLRFATNIESSLASRKWTSFAKRRRVACTAQE